MRTKTCDHAMAGVVLRDPSGAVLLVRWDSAPAGWAPLSAHVHDGDHPLSGRYEPGVRREYDRREYAAAAITGACEGLGVTPHPDRLDCAPVFIGWRGDRCRRFRCVDGTACPGPGHTWSGWVVDVDARPAVTVDGTEISAAMWASATDLEYLVGRTLSLITSRAPLMEWRDRAGIDPVWVRWLVEAGMLDIAHDTLEWIEKNLNLQHSWNHVPLACSGEEVS